MGLMIDQGLIPRLLNLIEMRKYNLSALWTLDNVLYNNETGEARKIAVCIAHEGGAVKTLTDILCAGYNPSQRFVSTDGASCEIVNAAIHCLRIMVLNDESSRKEMVKLPSMEEILMSMSQIQIKIDDDNNDQIRNAIYQDVKNVATHIIEEVPEWSKVPSAEEILKDMRQQLPQLVQRIKKKKTDVKELWTLDNVLYDDKADKVRRGAVDIAQKEGVVEILIENVRAWYFPERPYKYSLQPFTSATIHCLRIMVANDERSKKMVVSANIRHIIDSIMAHPEAHDTVKKAAEHILQKI